VVALEVGDVGHQGEDHEEEGCQSEVGEVFLDVDEEVGEEHEDEAAEDYDVGLEEVVGDDEADEEGLQEQQLLV